MSRGKQADGGWLIAHDHCSAPFDPYTEKAVLSPDTAGNAAPDTCGETNPAGWFEIYVADMERAKAFYTAVFGYEFTRLESPIELWAFPMQPTSYGASGIQAWLGCQAWMPEATVSSSTSVAPIAPSRPPAPPKPVARS